MKQLQPEISELENAITLLSRDIDKKRAELGGVNAAAENNGAIEKQIRVLENRLDKVRISEHSNNNIIIIGVMVVSGTSLVWKGLTQSLPPSLTSSNLYL